MPPIRFVASCEEVRRLDTALAADSGLSGAELMEIAGAGCFLLLRPLLDRAGRAVVVCGPGQNGGDGLVIARYAASAGAAVSVFAMKEPSPGAAAALQRKRLTSFGVPVSVGDLSALRKALAAEGAVVVDALFGTGVTQPLRPEAVAWVDAIDTTRGTIASIDLPSGLDGDSGRAGSGCVRAAVTLTIGALKPGLLAPEGAARAGRIEVVPLPYPPHRTRDWKRIEWPAPGPPQT
jgi:NAD(P)H-hydrate epimerase